MGDIEPASSDTISIRAQSIAVIGAGPSGLAAARYLRAEKAFSKIVLFEQRPSDGGIWNYSPDDRAEDLFTVPQTDPVGKNQEPIWRETESKTAKDGGEDGGVTTTKVPTFVSPVYEKLETNIPRGLMGFKDYDWPEESQLFPTHETVLKYIQDYGSDVQDLIRYSTQVTNAVPTDPSSACSPWTVTSRNLQTSGVETETFDALIVANGHFITPYIPSIPGIAEWHATHPGRISHSKYYRRAEEFAGKKVVVVGNSASGADISSQIATHAALPVLWSSKSSNLFVSATPPDPHRRQPHPPIARFHAATRGVEFENGVREDGIDAVLFATGYFYSLPFLSSVTPRLITDGSHVHHTFKHLFFAPCPTLSFLALPQRVIPFPTAEAQAAVLARVYAGRLALPSMSTMRAWESSRIEAVGAGRAFHLLPFPHDGENINEMAAWALGASRREGLDNGGRGLLPPVWGEWEFWCRERFPAIRQAFGQLGEGRAGVRRVEEVGFLFEEGRGRGGDDEDGKQDDKQDDKQEGDRLGENDGQDEAKLV